MVRTPREWDEPCPECHGVGRVHRRESFSLWTPEEFAAQPLDAKHDVPRDAVVCTACPGATIGESCKEGVALARAYGRPVAFEFNGGVAVCRPGSNPEDVVRLAWISAYGETYEESARRR